MILRKREDTGNWQRKNQIVVWEELALKETVDLSNADYVMTEYFSKLVHDYVSVETSSSYYVLEKIFVSYHYSYRPPGSLVSIATGYGLDGQEIESRWGLDFTHLSPERPWGPPSLLYNGYRVFPGGKERPGRDADPPSPSSVIGHERVELYLYSPCGPYGLYWDSVPVQGCSLLLPFTTRIFMYACLCIWGLDAGDITRHI